MRIYLLGACGTFMAGLAVLLAKKKGMIVGGADLNVYPPMSDVLSDAGIEIDQGYNVQALKSFAPDLVVIANAISRGNPCLEYVLNAGLHFSSGPAVLAQYILANKRVIAIAGTHGKTTTTSMVSHILDDAGLNPGFLIGGVANNFDGSVRLTESDLFVIEADEYDTAFFDKRAKFVHYFPEIALINNLEFDHADIYPDLGSIIRQFHHMIRIIPSKGHLICGENNLAMQQLLAKGIWCEYTQLDPETMLNDKNGTTEIEFNGRSFTLSSHIQGKYNASNALSAIAVCQQLGVDVEASLKALETFKGVKRRLELIFDNGELKLYDDFAHHPTAIKAVLNTLRSKKPQRILVVLEFGSRSMQFGSHNDRLVEALKEADHIYCQRTDNLKWSLDTVLSPLKAKLSIAETQSELLHELEKSIQSGDQLILMRNTGFGRLKEKVLALCGGQRD